MLPSCDRGVALAASRGPGSAPTAQTAHPRMVLATTVLASSLAFIDGSVVNVGLPSIAVSFPSQTVSLSWVVSGYLLPLSALLLLGGAAGDRFGHRRLLLIGIGLFFVATLLCSWSPDLLTLIAGRVLQGVGAAMLMPTSLAILGSSFEGEARGKAIGTWAAAGAAAGAIGPLIGGWLIDLVGWRSMFLLNVPVAAAAFYLGTRFVKDPPLCVSAPLDWIGAVLVTGGLAGLTWGLTLASGLVGWAGPTVWSMGTGGSLIVLFVVFENRRGTNAMMPLSLFASRAFVGLSLVTFLLYGGLGGLLVLLPYLLIDLKGYSASQAGAALLPMPLVIALTAPTMGRLAANIGPRLPLTIGPAVVAIGFLLALRIPASENYWTATLPAMLVISLGMAGAVAPLTTAVLGSVAAQHSGIASGFNSALARTGGLIATALGSGVLVAHGPGLQSSFRTAMVLGAAAAASASICAFLRLARTDKENTR